jgi:hypothetical protein
MHAPYAPPVRAELTGSDRCHALGIETHGVLDLRRKRPDPCTRSLSRRDLMPPHTLDRGGRRASRREPRRWV